MDTPNGFVKYITSQSREQNRKDFPFAAQMMDDMRKVFGDGVKLIYAEENGKRVGTKPNVVEFVA